MPTISPTSGTSSCATRSARPTDTEGTYEFYEWIWNSLYENKPFDQFVRDLLTAAGDPRVSPAAIWYREVDEINEQVEDTAQLFLGLRIQCARCHHHPFEKWSQDDYYGFSAFFSRVGRKPLTDDLSVRMRERRLYPQRGHRRGRPIRGRASRCGRRRWAASRSRSRPIAIRACNWPTGCRLRRIRSSPGRSSTATGSTSSAAASSSPKTTCGKPIRRRIPSCSTRWLQHFIKSGFDLKDLVRTICRSSTYQLSAVPNDFNTKDRQNFSRYYPRRLRAEVLYDAFHQVTAHDAALRRPARGNARDAASRSERRARIS